MSLLDSASLLQSWGGHRSNTAQNGRLTSPELGRRPSHKQRPLRTTSSLGNLIQFAKNPVENLSEAVENWYDGSTKEERVQRQHLEDTKQLLYLKMRLATTYQGWETSAKGLDELERNNEWKAILDSPDYDVALVQTRLKQLENARISCDIERMLFLIRTSLTRDLGEMGNLKMYQHSHIGTKDLIERYINTALDTIDGLLTVSEKAKCDGMESKYILEQVLSARQAFGRSALLLSGGATFGMNHIGVLRALWEAKLLPRIISGASAGSIVCAVMCTRTDEEIPELLDGFCDGNLAVFDEEGSEGGILQKVVRFLKHGALFDISHLTKVMRELLGDLTFQEAYNRTRRILNICVSSAGLYELPRLLNYVTAPNVLIWSAVSASCSVPFVYTAASLLAKDPKTGEAVSWDPSPQRWIDGSVDNDIPMTRLAEMFNVNHFIVSQVNPHVVPFLTKDEKSLEQEPLHSSIITPGPGWLDSLSQLAKGEALHRMRTLAEFGVFPNILTKTVSVLSQKYSGDITIFPEISYADFPRMLSNPTREYMHLAMLSGQRATWPKLSVIKNHCAIELALDNAVQKLRARVVFSDEAVESRMAPRQPKYVHEVHPRATKTHSNARRTLSREIALSGSASGPASTPNPGLRLERGRSSRSNPSTRHKKSLSINTFLVQPDRKGATGETRPSTADAGLGASTSYRDSQANTKYLHDVTSSGADETSNLSHSSSSTSLELSSPTESPSSPAEATPKWSRAYFGSSSQPTTPTTGFDSLSLSMSKVDGTDKVPPKASGTSEKQSSSGTSTPGLRYKRFFSRTSPGPHTASPNPPPKSRSSTPSKKDSPRPSKKNWGMEIDIPATAKGIVGKGKLKGKKGNDNESGTA